MKLKPYEKYKDSGVEWIAEIPESWEIRRLKFNSKINPSEKRKLTNPNLKINFLPMEKVFEDGTYDSSSKTKYENVSKGYTYFEDNDVLLAKITPCFENGKGALVQDLDYGFGFGTTEFHILRTNKYSNSKFLFYITRSHLFRVMGEAFMEGAAGQKRVSTEFVKNFLMPTPPVNEQKQIANFLDKKTLAIDKAIEKNKQLIELLEEKRISLINHVVTKGLDPNAKMKDSGVEWIGEIPENWWMMKLKFVSEIIMGQSPNSEDYNYDKLGVPFLQGNAEFGKYNPEPLKYCDNANKFSRKNDILISVRAPVGQINISNQKYAIGRGLAAIRSDEQMKNYLWYALNLFKVYFYKISSGSTFDAVSIEDIKLLPIIVPTIKEQIDIVQYLNKKTLTIDGAIEFIKKNLNLLEEYKKSLIHHVVTGKSNVLSYIDCY